jgi:hypothetical protein
MNEGRQSGRKLYVPSARATQENKAFANTTLGPLFEALGQIAPGVEPGR